MLKWWDWCVWDVGGLPPRDLAVVVTLTPGWRCVLDFLKPHIIERTKWDDVSCCVCDFVGLFSRWWFRIFFIFTPKIGEMIHFDEHIFQMGWNHQLVFVATKLLQRKTQPSQGVFGQCHWVVSLLQVPQVAHQPRPNDACCGVVNVGRFRRDPREVGRWWVWAKCMYWLGVVPSQVARMPVEFV